MRKTKYLILLAVSLLPYILSAQQTINVQEGMQLHEHNYRTFTPQYRHISAEAQRKNTGNANHPELGMLFAEAPAANCYELIDARTELSKTFAREGSNGTEILCQTSTEAMHYKNAAGQWMTIKTRLQQQAKGIYAANEQPVPVNVNANEGWTAIGAAGKQIVFNNDLELIYLTPKGKQKNLGHASWKNYTAGDDGVYVTDAWAGIDMEIYTTRGTTKTNFYIKHAMPKYAGGKLLVRDHIHADDGMQLHAAATADFKGNLEVRKDDGKPVYLISAATAYEQQDIQHTLQMIGYNIEGNVLDIVLPGDFLNRVATAYPVVIDPLVTTSTASAVGGSSYSPTNTVSCNYVNVATVPANVTVTDVRWSFNYTASGGALLLNGAIDFMQGTCRSPATAGFFWFCNLSSAGTCTGTNVSIYSDIVSCISAPQCASYPLNLTMRFYQNFAATLPCATTYVTAGSPLTITVSGRTVETSPVNSAGGLTSICTGQSVTLSTTPAFGVPPYTYVWNPSATAGNPAVLTPTVTTPYTVTVTDACGQTAQTTQTIVVGPLPPVTGTTLVCVGGTTTLSNSSGAGTWSSTNGAVAVIGPSTGVVTGLSAGTTTISFVNAVGCYATTTVTVIAMPGTISGSAEVCVGISSTLSNPMPGGTWTSSIPGVAVVGAGTGIITGMTPGTSTIVYTTSPGCTASVVVTVHPNPAISSVIQTDPSGCGASDGRIMLLGLTPGETYTVTYTAGSTPVSTTSTAGAGGQVVITGLTAGNYSSITVITADGCMGVLHGVVTLTDIGAPPPPTIVTNAPICDGSTLTLSATSVAGATFSWTGPAGFFSTLPNPSISPAFFPNAGVYSVTATFNGCVSLPAMVTVVINPVPVITNVTFTNPVTCGGNEGSITLEGLIPGVVYNVAYTINGTTIVTASITADAGGYVTITGLKEGTYTDIYVESLTCIGKTGRTITLKDPPPPPAPAISSNAPICEGLTLLLYGSNANPGGSYYWEGPNGFTSSAQNPIILNSTIAAEGVYTLTYSFFNCKSKATNTIKLQPVIKLTNVYASGYVVVFGDSVQLHADGATYYVWAPHDKTLSDNFISDPWAKPTDSIATYTVQGVNEWGCRDSASLTLRVIFDEDEYIPNSFTPNNDGRNDIFRIGKMKYKKLIDFTIYNRWGQEVYHNSYDPNGGWDGTSGGKKQDIGVYYYSITLESASGKLRYYKGDVTLIR